MIHGCAENAPQTVDLARLRCPPVAAADTRALRQQPAPPPAGDVTDSKLRGWIDAKDHQINTMRLAGGRVIRQYDRCRLGAR